MINIQNARLREMKSLVDEMKGLQVALERMTECGYVTTEESGIIGGRMVVRATKTVMDAQVMRADPKTLVFLRKIDEHIARINFWLDSWLTLKAHTHQLVAAVRPHGGAILATTWRMLRALPSRKFFWLFRRRAMIREFQVFSGSAQA